MRDTNHNFYTLLLLLLLFRQVKTSDIISRRFGDFMTPLSRLQIEQKLTNARSRVTTQSDLHSGGGYTNTLARIESACTIVNLASLSTLERSTIRT